MFSIWIIFLVLYFTLSTNFKILDLKIFQSLNYQNLMFPSENQDRNQNQTSALPRCEQFFTGIPIICLLFYILLVGLWVLNLFLGIQDGVANSYKQTVGDWQLWRVLTSAFYQPSLLFIFFIIINFQTFLPSLVISFLSKEIKKGSSFLLVDLISRNLKVQVLSLLLLFTLSSFSIDTSQFKCGAMGLWFNYLTIFCFLNPKTMKLCCFNIKFNRNIYPFLFGPIICLLYWEIRIDLLVGILLGICQVTFTKNLKDAFQSNIYIKMDGLAKRIGISSFKNWVSFNSVSSMEKICTFNVYSNLEFQQNQFLSSNDQMEERTNYSQENKKNDDPFAKLKGVRIGDY